MPLHFAMTGRLEAVTQDAERLREWWATDGVLEFPYDGRFSRSDTRGTPAGGEAGHAR